MLKGRFDLNPERVELKCSDGVTLVGHFWAHKGNYRLGVVIVNPATGVVAGYYHRYAAFLTEWGFDVLTYDYRGIGLSRPPQMRGCPFRWRDWGEKDFDGVLKFVESRCANVPIYVVGHSFGGVIPGLAESGSHVYRILTVGAQFAYWRDYQRSRRLHLFLKWHVVMPVVTALFGYFPGKRFGWLEDLPAGVANEWSSQRSRFELSYPLHEREDVLRRFRNVTAPILAITVSDDELGTPCAVRRTLAYYRSSRSEHVVLNPSDFGEEATGHFGLFHCRHASGFWIDTVMWLRDGINPWPRKRVSQEMSL
jgi:predicted alpha/beta hydrolase